MYMYVCTYTHTNTHLTDRSRKLSNHRTDCNKQWRTASTKIIYTGSLRNGFEIFSRVRDLRAYQCVQTNQRLKVNLFILLHKLTTPQQDGAVYRHTVCSMLCQVQPLTCHVMSVCLGNKPNVLSSTSIFKNKLFERCLIQLE